MPASVFVFQIGVSIENHQRAFPFEKTHELRYAQARRNTYQHVNVVRARLCLNNFNILLLTQFS